MMSFCYFLINVLPPTDIVMFNNITLMYLLPPCYGDLYIYCNVHNEQCYLFVTSVLWPTYIVYISVHEWGEGGVVAEGGVE